MKRILSVVLALSLSLSLLAVSAFASATAKDGGFYYANGTRITDEVDSNSIVPGDTVYFAICEYDADDPIKKASLTSEGSDSKKLLKSDSDIEVVRLKDDGGERWYFAVLNVKTISAKDYEEDGSLDYEGELKVKFKESDDQTYEVSFTADYDDGGSTFEEYLQYYEYEKGDDLEIEADNEDLVFTATATGTGRTVAAVNTDTIEKLEEKYGDKATLGYFTCTGTFNRVKNAKLTLDGANTYRYCYGYSNGKLVDIDANYSSKNDAFTIKFSGSTAELGTYVLSDVKLSASSSASATTDTTETSSSSSAASSSSSSVVNPSYIPANPSTGAAL